METKDDLRTNGESVRFPRTTVVIVVSFVTISFAYRR